MTDRAALQSADMAPTASQREPAAAVGPRAGQPAQHDLSQLSVAPVRVQASLTVGAPGDKYEREADQVADAVMRMPEPGAPVLQRACAACEEEELQPSRLGSAPAGGIVVGGDVAGEVASARQGGSPLSTADRDFFEPRLGHSLSAVRLHSGGAAAQAARSVSARAFTVGSDIVMGAGQPGAGTAEGRRLLAHELTHVVQQGHAPMVED